MIRLIGLGKIKETSLQHLINDYVKRIQFFTKFELIELKDVPNTDKDSLNQVAITQESTAILEKIRDRDRVILLDLQGKLIDSVTIGTIIQDNQNHAFDSVFIIGGSLGVDQRVRDRAQVQWKLSANTFPHGLVRLLVVEQIYRAFKINHKQNYHK